MIENIFPCAYFQPIHHWWPVCSNHLPCFVGGGSYLNRHKFISSQFTVKSPAQLEWDLSSKPHLIRIKGFTQLSSHLELWRRIYFQTHLGISRIQCFAVVGLFPCLLNLRAAHLLSQDTPPFANQKQCLESLECFNSLWLFLPV